MDNKPAEVSPLKIGLALSGGGSRAIAFHLGCMRALNDRGLLSKVQVLSTVSGGSVIGALWAYSDDSFEEFDKRVQTLLKKGLIWGIVKNTFFSPEAPLILASILTSGVLAALGASVRVLIAGLGLIVPGNKLKVISGSLQAPLPRFASITTAFIRYLDKAYFKGTSLKQVKRAGLDVVINATELRTETAFRFGSVETGSWRFGKLACEETVAKAVAASAAFPALFPAIDQKLRFINKGNNTKERVIITDGGVYDNLGISCLVPGRDRDFSTNVHDVDFIIACVAGKGLPDASTVPYFLGTRLLSTVNTIHLRNQAMTIDLLHSLKETNQIKGFLLPYLGQQDSSLPRPPVDLVPRDATFDYPTNLDAMSDKDLELLTKRGEQLVHNLIETYHPDI